MPEVNYLAVVVAGVASFFIGGLWYSKAMFCDLWIREAEMQPKIDNKQTKHPGKVFAVSIPLAVISAWVLAILLGPHPDVATGALRGCLVGAGCVAASFGINYGFASRSTKLWLIDGGYHTAQFTLCGAVLGLFG